jgi:hypothetical protein
MAQEHPDDCYLKWELLVADLWADPALKKRLLDDPAAVLKERGIAFPEGCCASRPVRLAAAAMVTASRPSTP